MENHRKPAVRYGNLIGKTFARLTVTNGPAKGAGPSRYWICTCECGSVRPYDQHHLVTSHTQSCGCLQVDVTRTRNVSATKHIGRHENKRLFQIWRAMHQRCENPDAVNYINYGGRGIAVCHEWETYIPFRDWALSNGYTDDLTIDREDNSKGYSSDNCRWVTMTVQNNNRRDNVLLTAFGETKTMAEWSRDPRCAVSYNLLQLRMSQAGADAETALVTAPYSDVVTAFGEAKTVAQWSRDTRCAVSYKLLAKRLSKSGIDPERAITTPSRTKR